MQISSDELGRMAGLTRRSIHNWIDAGLLKPCRINRGKRCLRDVLAFDEADVLRVLLAQELRRRGFPLASIGAILQQLASWSLEELENQFADGRDTLVCSGSVCWPDFVAWGDIDIRAVAEVGAPLAIINVETLVRRVQSLLEQHEGATA